MGKQVLDVVAAGPEADPRLGATGEKPNWTRPELVELKIWPETLSNGPTSTDNFITVTDKVGS